MKRLFVAIEFLSLVWLLGENAFAQSGYDLFQKGLVQEQATGNLTEAIRLYKQIIDNHQDDRALVAKALVQIGGCYEKLGQSEAQRAYEEILAKYADQPEPVAQARARLAALRQATKPADRAQQTGPVTQELKLSYMRDLSQSRDGTKLLYTASRNGNENVVMRDLVTGEETQLTHYPRGDDFATAPIFSPDASRIAYTSISVDSVLHIVSLQTREDRPLIQGQAPLDWSKDGRFILLGWTPARNRMNYSVLSIDNVEVKKLKLELRYDKSDCCFSPDAQYVSYSDNGHLYLYHIDTDKIIELTNGSTEDEQPLWCPDGKTILFLSRRAFGPERELCTLPVIDGRVAGDVRIVIPDFGDEMSLRSLSQTGRLLYEQTFSDKYVCSITVDPGTGEPLGEVTRMVGGTHAVWSPDGSRIAYVADDVLHVMSANGHEDQTVVPVGFHLSGSYSWAPDNDTIYMPEIQGGHVTISAISISNKEKRTIWPGDGKTGAMHLTCSPDGKRLAFVKHVGPQNEHQLFIMEVDGTSLRQLTPDGQNTPWYPSWSPDGRHIACMSRSGDVSTLILVSIQDGTITEAFRGSTTEDRFFHKSWSPDGRKIVWGTKDSLHIGEIATRKYRPLNMNVVQPMAPCWSPDGSKILFNTTTVEKVMVIDSFLPASAGAKDSK